MDNTVLRPGHCPGCGDENLTPTSSEEVADRFCEVCDVESELYCSAREACVGYYSLTGSGFQAGAAGLASCFPVRSGDRHS